MSFPIRKAIGVLAIAGLSCVSLLGVGCGSGGDGGSERAVEWGVDRPVGSKWVRISAPIEVCIPDLPLLEEPIIDYKGNRVYIELRHTTEDENGICFLNLPMAFKKITFERDLDELVLFDASTAPPEQRWPLRR